MPPRWVRRSLTPFSLAVMGVLLVACVAGVIVGLVLAPFGRRRRLLRVSAFGAGYLALDTLTLAAAFALWLRHPLHRGNRERPWIEDHLRLLHWALGAILAWAGRCVGFRVALDLPAAADGTPFPDGRPVLVLARHAGPGDSFALVHLLLHQWGRRVHIVLKEILQADPALDVVLNRVGCCFIPGHHGSAAGRDLPARLADLARRLGDDDILLVFPEGGNWTPRRRVLAIRRLRRDGKQQAARAATLMEHVLPPRPAGVQAVLSARPRLPVVLAAHAGLDHIASAGQTWSALPFRRPMTVRLWPASPPPALAADGDGSGEVPDALVAWLTTEWAVVDEWVDRHRPED